MGDPSRLGVIFPKSISTLFFEVVLIDNRCSVLQGGAISTPLMAEQKAAVNQSGEEACRRRGKLANPPTYKEVSEGVSSAGLSQEEISIVSKSGDKTQKKPGVPSKPVTQNSSGSAHNTDEMTEG